MIAQLALKMLLNQRARLTTALLGVVFVLVLINLQAGLFVGLLSKAGLLVGQAEADIWIGHDEMNNVDFPKDIPRDWAHLVRADQDVAWARPCTLGATEMTVPGGGFETVFVVGFDRRHYQEGRMQFVAGRPQDLLRPDAIAIDECDAYKLGDPELGQTFEVGGHRTKLVAKTYGATSFVVSPYVFTTESRARQLLNRPSRSCSYVLVKARSGVDIEALASRLQARLPAASVMTGEQYCRVSEHFWLTRTGLGISFGTSTLLGLIVGIVISGQAIYAIALDRVTEFAALKAMGASSGQLLLIVFVQSAAIAVLGSGMGLVATLVLQSIFHTPTAPIILPAWILVGVAGGVCLMCLLACLVPFWRLRKIDPLLVLGS